MKQYTVIFIAISLPFPSFISAATVHFTDDVSLKLGGSIQYDTAHIDHNGTSLTDSDVRRARVKIKGKWGKNVRSYVQYELSGNSPTLKDAYIEYRGFPKTRVKAGNIQTATGFEKLTSSNNLLFMERSLPNALFPNYRVGAEIRYYNNDFTFTAGFAGGTATTWSQMKNQIDTQKVVYGRVTKKWSKEASGLLHLGGSFIKVDPKHKSVRFRSKSETNFGNSIVNTGRMNDIDTYTTTGIEAAWIKDDLLLQGEYIQTDLDRAGKPDESLSGGYIAASYLLKGGKRRYDKKKGLYKGVVLEKREKALELKGRISQLDLNSHDIQGGKAKSATVGLNYYLNNKTRIMFDYGTTKASPDKNGNSSKDKVMQLRLQVSF